MLKQLLQCRDYASHRADFVFQTNANTAAVPANMGINVGMFIYSARRTPMQICA